VTRRVPHLTGRAFDTAAGLTTRAPARDSPESQQREQTEFAPMEPEFRNGNAPASLVRQPPLATF